MVTSAAACAQRAREVALAGTAFALGGDDGADDRRRLLDAAVDDLDGLPDGARRQVLRRMALVPAVTAWELTGSREDAWLAVAAAVDIDRPPAPRVRSVWALATGEVEEIRRSANRGVPSRFPCDDRHYGYGRRVQAGAKR